MPSEPYLHQLANGIRVICDPMPGLETLALTVVAGQGARSEDRVHCGWSHLLEHMVFKGAGHRNAREIVERIEAAGGHINAATGYERTSFQVRALESGLLLGLETLADLVLHPTLDADDLEREKAVVGQEIAEAADTPDDLVFEMAQSAAFGDNPLGWSILGTAASIADASPLKLEAWRSRLYTPETLVISAAGAVDMEALFRHAESHFGAPVSGTHFSAQTPAVFAGGAKAAVKRLEQAHLVLMLPAVGAAHPDYFAWRLFAEALGGGMASRLFQEAREKRGLVYTIDAYLDSYRDLGLLGIYAGCAAVDAVETAKLAAEQVLLLGANVTEAELARSKAQLLGQTFMAREQPLARAEQAAGQVLLFDRLRSAAEVAAGIQSVQPADFARIIQGATSAGLVAGAVLGSRPAEVAVQAFSERIAQG